MVRPKKSLMLGAGLGSFLLGACSTTPNYHLKNAPNSLLQTRVALMDVCPVSLATAKLEGAASGVIDALIAPIIDVGISTIGTALTNAAAKKTVTFSGQTNSRFYKTDATTRPNPYQLQVNSDNGCLIVVHGYFSDKAPDDFKEGHPLKGFEEDLYAVFGLADEPLFYFEGSLAYSKDQAGFRIRTELLHSDARMMDHKSSDRSYKMKFTFSKPSGDVGGKAFSIGEINLGSLDQDTVIQAPPFVGYSTRIVEYQTGLGTGYLPLPALDTSVASALKAGATRVTTLDTLIANIRVKLIGLGIISKNAIPASTPSSDIFNLLTSRQVRADLMNMREQLKQTIANSEITVRNLTNLTSSDMQKAQAALEEAHAPQSNAAAKAARLVARLERLNKAKLDLTVATKKLLQAKERLKTVEELLSVPKDLRRQAAQIAADSDLYAVAQPFIVKVDIEETRPRNEMLAFFASVFNAADDNIATALKEELDPVTKKALEEAEIKEKEALQSASDQAKVQALTAVLKLQGFTIQLSELQDDASASQRFTIEQSIRLATLEAKTKCRDARALGAAPIECAPY